jgi:uncharacterized protein YecT (DUF1311 family)
MNLRSLLLPFFPFAAFAATDCESTAKDKSEVLACLHSESMGEVRAQYSSLYARLKGSDPVLAKALSRSQRSWETFVDDSCQVHILLSNAVPDDTLVGCWREFSHARVKVLRSWEQQAISVHGP